MYSPFQEHIYVLRQGALSKLVIVVVRISEPLAILGENNIGAGALFSILKVHLLYTCIWLVLYPTFFMLRKVRAATDRLGLWVDSSATPVGHSLTINVSETMVRKFSWLYFNLCHFSWSSLSSLVDLWSLMTLMWKELTWGRFFPRIDMNEAHHSPKAGHSRW